MKYKWPFEITQYWPNGTVALQRGVTKYRDNVTCIKPYISDTQVDNMID